MGASILLGKRQWLGTSGCYPNSETGVTGSRYKPKLPLHLCPYTRLLQDQSGFQDFSKLEKHVESKCVLSVIYSSVTLKYS